MLQILAATSNKHKVEEFKAAFAPLLSKMTILTADEIHGYPDIEENGTSFEENADIKAREALGYSYETADGSLALLLQSHLGAYRPHFTLESFRVIVDDHEDTGALAKDAMSEATIKIHVGDRRFVATGEGAGPVGALDNALRMAIVAFYPEVADIELVDYKVRILDENVGTDAITRVVITTRDKRGSWGTVGVSENIIEASWNALVDSIEYGLMRIGE